MNADFHYYATYCAAILAGYSHEESEEICYSAQLVDHCTKAFLQGIGAPLAAATTQQQLELMDTPTDILGLQEITRIWASFHFLPHDLTAEPKKRCSKRYKNKYRLICGPNGSLIEDTVNLAAGKGTQAVGVAMHVLADTWAHRYFAGTPSLAINNTNHYFYELFEGDDGDSEKLLKFRHSASAPDDLDNSLYTASLYSNSENSIMNLGHGRAGHLPDYSFIRYKYLPAWGGYEEIIKDNPSDYKHAFCQMIDAMRCLHDGERFERDCYALDVIAPYEDEIDRILRKRQLSAEKDWKALGEKLSGHTITDFDISRWQQEYRSATKHAKDDTYLGKFILAALAQKSMVTNRIYQSSSKLAGYSIEYRPYGFKGIKAYRKLIQNRKGGQDR